MYSAEASLSEPGTGIQRSSTHFLFAQTQHMAHPISRRLGSLVQLCAELIAVPATRGRQVAPQGKLNWFQAHVSSKVCKSVLSYFFRLLDATRPLIPWSVHRKKSVSISTPTLLPSHKISSHCKLTCLCLDFPGFRCKLIPAKFRLEVADAFALVPLVKCFS